MSQNVNVRQFTKLGGPKIAKFDFYLAFSLGNEFLIHLMSSEFDEQSKNVTAMYKSKNKIHGDKIVIKTTHLKINKIISIDN